ncbi:unnamed protein product [Trichogramma brassicae]|uniref:Suppressor of forked domain-containing protein n=1 Tax=Trichogramma brassicae TaxID=86971 RepID=A0A6H5I1F0_9HYME|nr:unnamed protein product [Trichogramma brassicae]
MQSKQKKYEWNWDNSKIVKPVDDQDESSSDDEAKEEVSVKKKKLSAAERREFEREKERLIREKEEFFARNATPSTVEQFERLVIARPNSSILWIRFMAYYLENTEIEKARATAKRALKTIVPRQEQERLNVVYAWLNLEETFGTPESLERVSEAAIEVNDPLKVYQHLLADLSRDSSREKENRTKKAKKDDHPDLSAWSMNQRHVSRKEIAHSMAQLIKDEKQRYDKIEMLFKSREKSLNDRTKKLVKLEEQKRALRDTGQDSRVSSVKKKQRALLLKLQQEKDEMNRLKELHKIASQERKLMLQKQRDMFNPEMSTKNILNKLKRSADSHSPRKISGPMKGYDIRSNSSISSLVDSDKSMLDRSNIDFKLNLSDVAFNKDDSVLSKLDLDQSLKHSINLLDHSESLEILQVLQKVSSKKADKECLKRIHQYHAILEAKLNKRKPSRLSKAKLSESLIQNENGLQQNSDGSCQYSKGPRDFQQHQHSDEYQNSLLEELDFNDSQSSLQALLRHSNLLKERNHQLLQDLVDERNLANPDSPVQSQRDDEELGKIGNTSARSQLSLTISHQSSNDSDRSYSRSVVIRSQEDHHHHHHHQQHSGLKTSKKLEQILRAREATLVSRRNCVDEWMAWHARLRDEEHRVARMEQAAFKLVSATSHALNHNDQESFSSKHEKSGSVLESKEKSELQIQTAMDEIPTEIHTSMTQEITENQVSFAENDEIENKSSESKVESPRNKSPTLQKLCNSISEKLSDKEEDEESDEPPSKRASPIGQEDRDSEISIAKNSISENNWTLSDSFEVHGFKEPNDSKQAHEPEEKLPEVPQSNEQVEQKPTAVTTSYVPQNLISAMDDSHYFMPKGESTNIHDTFVLKLDDSTDTRIGICSAEFNDILEIIERETKLDGADLMTEPVAIIDPLLLSMQADMLSQAMPAANYMEFAPIQTAVITEEPSVIEEIEAQKEAQNNDSIVEDLSNHNSLSEKDADFPQIEIGTKIEIVDAIQTPLVEYDVLSKHEDAKDFSEEDRRSSDGEQLDNLIEVAEGQLDTFEKITENKKNEINSTNLKNQMNITANHTLEVIKDPGYEDISEESLEVSDILDKSGSKTNQRPKKYNNIPEKYVIRSKSDEVLRILDELSVKNRDAQLNDKNNALNKIEEKDEVAKSIAPPTSPDKTEESLAVDSLEEKVKEKLMEIEDKRQSSDEQQNQEDSLKVPSEQSDLDTPTGISDIDVDSPRDQNENSRLDIDALDDDLLSDNSIIKKNEAKTEFRTTPVGVSSEKDIEAMIDKLRDYIDNLLRLQSFF